MKKVISGAVETIAGLLVAAAAVWYFLAGGGAEGISAKKNAEPPKVEAVKMELSKIRDTIEGLGTGEASESADLSSTVTEIVTEVHFENGQKVSAGDLLIRLADAQEQAEKRQAEVNLAEEERELNRIETMFRAKAASEKSRDEQLTRVARMKTAISIISAQIRDREIRAPFSGTLGTRDVSPGDLVTPGSRITTIDDLTSVDVRFGVSEKYFSSVHPGDTAEVSAEAFPGRTFRGKVTYTGTRIDPGTRMFTVKANVPNPESLLRSGMMFRVRLGTSGREALMIPEKAVLSLGEMQYVYLLNPDRTVSKREIATGLRENGLVEAVAGLKPGELLVVSGISKLTDGLSVDPVAAGEKGK